MDKYLKDEYIKDKFDSFPKTIQDIIINSGWEQSLLKISKKHGLRIDQTAELEREVLFVILGIDLEENLNRNMRDSGIDQDAISPIKKDLSEMIFEPMLSKLENQTDKEDAAFEKVQPTTLAPEIEPREEILKQIESIDSEFTQPVEKKENPIVNNKMSQPSVSEPVTPEPKIDSPQSIDPYRESIE